MTTSSSEQAVITATKHHGLGNDFLVVLADVEPEGLDELAIAMCDRFTGIGADGLIAGVATPDADVRMVLHNADGSRAEMSGNGIRCLAQAVVRDRFGAEASAERVDLRILTDGGLRVVRVEPDAGGAADTIQAWVDMGPVGDGPGVVADVDGAEFVRRSATGDMGNPHLVVQVDDASAVDVAGVGAAFEAHYPEGMNVEFISPIAGEDTIELTVWERGAGVTRACGTGASAAATRAHQWGLVGPDVTVSMPGGTARVLVPTEPDQSATLIGPSVFIATVLWPEKGALRG